MSNCNLCRRYTIYVYMQPMHGLPEALPMIHVRQNACFAKKQEITVVDLLRLAHQICVSVAAFRFIQSKLTKSIANAYLALYAFLWPYLIGQEVPVLMKMCHAFLSESLRTPHDFLLTGPCSFFSLCSNIRCFFIR